MIINVIEFRKKVSLISASLIFIMTIEGLGQDFSFREYRVRDGLPQK